MNDAICLLVNPTAGRGRGGRYAAPTARVLRDAGHPVRAVVGLDASDALRRAREAVAGGARALVAVGGDGLVSLALHALAGTSTPLGIVAAGTGDDFARALGLPLRAPAAAAERTAAALAAGTATPVDLGRVGDRWFGTVLAAGFDSRVNDRANRMNRPRGRLRYDLAILAELATLRPVPFRLRLDEGPWQELDATLVAVGNGTSYGGGLRIAPGARTDDGRFDITVVGACSRRTLLRVLPSVRHGGHVDHPLVTVVRAARVTLAAAVTTAYADGDPLGGLPLTARTVPGAVRVLGADG
ncbi:YegS/Rv2252/BmrU family lipid kinase [Streptomyces bohaiensis]|uniref:YegS/Rv2252/BmrU family lipid kinase n=1 Tax=Streptomyces bohaiensis TaxID=1431344 RepID=A0ABX1CBK9_9ACTN|nr:YegS/Rv2252/BmrU family lipid kinase [Streptomyces bohaiensis]NJQ14772.1 YegS/Rv2252/BmrU family lipid kinase [Streptomyces bohaiensis]